uniref:CHK kinase-like domain-containing protein n=2 Tax=Scylla olivacea TaxID=85551 RepID=A0A0P4VY71_SCYOL
MSDKGAAAQLTAWKVVDFTKKGDNYACLVTSVEVKYEIDGKSSEVVYVVKINSGKTFGGENMFDLFFEKECKFFLDIAPQINSILREIGHTKINVPKCFHASLEKGKEVIFLEDLRARGYKMADRKQGLDEAHTILVLRELARLHAASLLLQNKTPDDDLGEKYPYLKIGMAYLVKKYNSMFKAIKDHVIFGKTIIKKVGGYERVAAWIDTIIPNLVDIFEQLECGEPKVVCHGDCWNNNLLFRYSETGHPEDVMLLDLQMIDYSAPATDLNYLLYTSTTGDVRKPNIEAFLGSYYTAFKDIMEAGGQTIPFTEAQLLKDFKDMNLAGLVFAMVFVPLVLFETEGEADTSKENKEDLAEMLRETREKSLETIETNPLVKPRFLSVFDEMMELGIIP